MFKSDDHRSIVNQPDSYWNKAGHQRSSSRTSKRQAEFRANIILTILSQMAISERLKELCKKVRADIEPAIKSLARSREANGWSDYDVVETVSVLAENDTAKMVIDR